jgi:membrane protease YdiL (CAAX protease family)
MASRKILIGEVLLVCLTAAGKFIFMDVLKWKFPFIAAVMLFWTVYVWRRYRLDNTVTRHWGFRWDNMSSVAKRMSLFGLLALLVMITTGYLRDTLQFTWHIFPILLLYPLWGTIQQFLVISLVAGNLQDLFPGQSKQPLILVVTAALFGLIHYPFGWLMAGTFVLALFYGYIFLRERNVFAMGLFHGWLGALFFYTVVGRDPFAEVFGNYLR